MCGLAGFVGKGELDDLRRMIGVLVHRGPDDSGTYVDAEHAVYLGFRRLSIVDIEGGHQPMWTSDATTGIVFNGEIYNFRELRSELEGLGHRFSSHHSDTEVLLYGYREWGTSLTERLNGMWAFALYDRPKGLLFCSRDRFGKKPFYYASTPGLFAFGSELHALAAHPCMPRGLSRPALRKYFAYGYIPAPLSAVEGVRKLPAGHSLVLDIASGALKTWKYWDFVLEPFEDIPADAESRWGEQLRDLIDRAVKRRLVADVPLGTFLSGGIDSSAVTAFAARHVAAGELNTFSIGFDDASFDESHHAQRVAEHLGTRHHPERLSLERAQALLPEIVGRLDEPLGDSSLLPTYLLCGHARKSVTVALGGDGADELFAGYDPFRALRLAQIYSRWVPRPVHAAIRLVVSRLPVSHRYMSLDFRLKRTLRGLSYPARLWCPVWMAPLEQGELDDLFGEPVAIEDVYSEAIDAWEACKQPNLVDRTLQFYTKLYLQDDILTKLDRASMMHSLEARCPFLDIELVDFVRHIPWQFKLRNGQTKYILKKALEPVLPHEILYRSKQGFGVPIGRWFQEGRFSLPSDPQLSTILGADLVREKLRSHRENRTDERAFLWNHWVLSMWDLHRNASV